MGSGLTLTETLLPQLGQAAPAVADVDWEAGRLVLSPDHRADVDALRHCLCLSLDHLRHSAEVRRLFAACTPVLGRLYRRFGFLSFARDVPLAGTAKTYTMIAGGCEEVYASLAGPAGAAQ